MIPTDDGTPLFYLKRGDDDRTTCRRTVLRIVFYSFNAHNHD